MNPGKKPQGTLKGALAGGLKLALVPRWRHHSVFPVQRLEMEAKQRLEFEGLPVAQKTYLFRVPYYDFLI